MSRTTLKIQNKKAGKMSRVGDFMNGRILCKCDRGLGPWALVELGREDAFCYRVASKSLVDRIEFDKAKDVKNFWREEVSGREANSIHGAAFFGGVETIEENFDVFSALQPQTV